MKNGARGGRKQSRCFAARWCSGGDLQASERGRVGGRICSAKVSRVISRKKTSKPSHPPARRPERDHSFGAVNLLRLLLLLELTAAALREVAVTTRAATGREVPVRFLVPLAPAAAVVARDGSFSPSTEIRAAANAISDVALDTPPSVFATSPRAFRLRARIISIENAKVPPLESSRVAPGPRDSSTTAAPTTASNVTCSCPTLARPSSVSGSFVRASLE